MTVGAAMGADMDMLADVLPAVERAVIASFRDEGGKADDAGAS